MKGERFMKMVSSMLQFFAPHFAGNSNDGKTKKKMYERNDKKNGMFMMPLAIIVATIVIFSVAFFAGWSLANFAFDAGKFMRTVTGLGTLFFFGKMWAKYIPVLKSEMAFYVPQNGFVVRKLFGRRLWGYLTEGGPYSKLPDFMETADCYSFEPTIDDISATFTTGDGFTVSVKGKLHRRPDPEIVNDAGRVRFAEISDEAISTEISKHIEGKLGSIGGLQSDKDLIKSRPAFAELVNQILRFSTPFHLRHPDTCNEPKCLKRWKGVAQINSRDVTRFYDVHWKIAKTLADAENQNLSDKSAMELLCGIDIVKFTLSDVSFDEETKKARSAQKHASMRSKTFGTALELAEEAVVTLPGISRETALNAAQAAIDPAVANQRHIIAMEGNGRPVVVLGNIGGVAGNNSAQQNSGGNTGGGSAQPSTPRRKGNRR